MKPIIPLMLLASMLAAHDVTADTGDWAAAVFGDGATTQPNDEISLRLVRQDHGQFGAARSVMDTPLRVGTRSFSHGLGTHSNSEIVLQIPPGKVKRLVAVAGIDSNEDTGGRLGSAQFGVSIDGKDVWTSGVKRGGEKGSNVDITIPAGATTITLNVNDNGDGPEHDHSDWADAHLVLADGSVVYLDALASPQLWPGAEEIPFSFQLAGTSSRQILAGWKREVAGDSVSWTDPLSGLKVTVIARRLDDCSAVEWVVHFHNTGASDSAIIQNVQVLDALLATGARRGTERGRK